MAAMTGTCALMGVTSAGLPRFAATERGLAGWSGSIAPPFRSRVSPGAALTSAGRALGWWLTGTATVPRRTTPPPWDDAPKTRAPLMRPGHPWALPPQHPAAPPRTGSIFDRRGTARRFLCLPAPLNDTLVFAS